MSESLQTCSFCHKHKDQVQKLIVSDMVAICNECVTLCQDLLVDSPAPTASGSSSLRNDIDPQELKSYLDQYVIGQDHAKIMLSVSIANHYKRLAADRDQIDLSKANVLMLGWVGSWKCTSSA